MAFYLRCALKTGVFPNWLDSATGVDFNGQIHLMGAAIGAITPSNKHYVYSYARQRLVAIDAPWGPRAEVNVSLLDDKMTIVGNSGHTQDVWQFDPAIAGNAAGSWTQLSSSHVAEIGNRYNSTGCDGGNGWFYLFGGWGNNTVVRTQTFLDGDWEEVATFPAGIGQLNSNGCCLHSGLIYLIGGSSNMPTNDEAGFYGSEINGHVYTFNPTTYAFTLVTTDKQKFGQMWIDACSDGTNLFVSKGYISESQYAAYSSPPAGVRTLNNRGFFVSTDNGANWSSMANEGAKLACIDDLESYAERHRASLFLANGEVNAVAGYGTNDWWRVVEE